MLRDVTTTLTLQFIAEKKTKQLNKPDKTVTSEGRRFSRRRGAKWMRTGGRKEPTCFMNVGLDSYHSDFEVFKRETFPAVQPDGNNPSTYYEPLAAR